MRNYKERKGLWTVAQIVHALAWATILILFGWMFGGESFHQTIFNILIFIAGLQTTVLAYAKQKLLKPAC